uniref:Uncharacterized protein n=1 Tax=Eubacterium cellulosolvens (strain ATCC 43171 / JCM 9499 / 6) TaxID=633697 RepID=I5ATN3_EUBC6
MLQAVIFRAAENATGDLRERSGIHRRGVVACGKMQAGQQRLRMCRNIYEISE